MAAEHRRVDTASLAAPESSVASTLRFTSNIVGPAILMADVICLGLSAVMALLLYDAIFDTPVVPAVHRFALVVVSVSFLLLRSSKQAYRQTLMNGLQDSGEAVFDAAVSVFLTAAVVWQFGFIDDYSRGVSVLYLFSLIATIIVSRPILRWFLASQARRGVIGQRVAFYGCDPISIATMQALMESKDLEHVRFVGVADDRPKHAVPDNLRMIGGYEQLAELARKGEVDQVFISLPDLDKARLRSIVDGLSQVAVDISLIPPQAIAYHPDYRANLLGTIPVLTLWQRPFRDINQFVKRGEDLVLGGLMLLAALPVIAITALAIRLTTRGPVFFVQPRVGFNNEVINVIKFRSMYADRSDFKGLATTTADDDRITPVGKIIRRLSIDELPQLFNVMRGDMSIVGPRPHATHMKVGDQYYVDAVRGYAARHRVKPGITGLAQVRGLRGEIRTLERAEMRVKLDKEYIENWSVWFDIKIMFATVRAVFFDSYAY
ncbi:undecaprenyl-phosphate glucose phosphotransferase [Sphingomonas rhizophila]|uniref:Undecaprenyl-phosphate glucose phosphotransferase n=1 Tax=Sphingomonas rhizophila TaxID=2071607 RepID=A0A7G9SBV6_9SPHN|nr:undecaprenyl-phosphate glucose phosphotransferase [Sphingomonas rhizophila]QNN65331.1 undecaprenyl-phosphate glucose phosphotransferase [Sphingomonas rhizophila]